MFVKGVEENRPEGKAEPWSFPMNSYVNCESCGAQVVLRIAPVVGEAPWLPCLCMTSLWKRNKEWYCALFLFLDTLHWELICENCLLAALQEPALWGVEALSEWVSCWHGRGLIKNHSYTHGKTAKPYLPHRVQLRQIPNHLSCPHTDADRKYPP